jgi:hypothetical protein
MALPQRVVGLLVRPAAEWAAIAIERDDVTAISQGYVSVLALVPSGSLLLGLAVAAGRYLGAVGITTAITAAVVSWVIVIAGSIASAVVVDKFAPVFDADGDLTQAFKLVAYSSTPFWLSGLFYVFDSASPLVAIGAAWSAYLLFRGASVVMKTPAARVLPFTAASVVAILVVNVALRAAFTLFKIPYMGF